MEAKNTIYFSYSFAEFGNPLTKCLNYTEDDHIELNESAVNRWDLGSSVTNQHWFILLPFTSRSNNIISDR